MGLSAPARTSTSSIISVPFWVFLAHDLFELQRFHTSVLELPTATASSQASPDRRAAKAPKTVTGCLRKGDPRGEITLTADGRVYDLLGDTVKFEEHIGHQVAATGTSTHEIKAQQKKDGDMEKASGKEPVDDLKVTTVKMISKTCENTK
jgi:hypothetical protein